MMQVTTMRQERQDGLWAGESSRGWTVGAALAAGLVLRLWWVLRFGQTTNDTRVYGEFAKNLLQFHVYGWPHVVGGVRHGVDPTLIRLPGYPLFLAACFTLFGMENYTAVMLVQVVVDLCSCLLLGGVAARVFGRRAGVATIWLASLCPFTANYVAAPLTETWTLFCMAAAFNGLVRWRERVGGSNDGIRRGLKPMFVETGEAGAEAPACLKAEAPDCRKAEAPAASRLVEASATLRAEAKDCLRAEAPADPAAPILNRWVGVIGVALAYAILLRPEQGMLAACVVSAMIWVAWRRKGLLLALRVGLVVSLITLAPLLPWTVRNWRVFHVFQPLAPRYATDPGERINYGFQRWFRTWGVEFASTVNVYWNYDGAPIAIADLPNRAFDSNAQYDETAAILAEYDLTDNASYPLDAKFDKLAWERIQADPLRYYVEMPVARVLNMMFRPRTELLPVEAEWWKFGRDRRWDSFAVGYAVLNVLFYAAAGWALCRRKLWRGDAVVVAAMVGTVVLRAALLLTMDNSEARYTLEFYPVVLVLAGAWWRDFYFRPRKQSLALAAKASHPLEVRESGQKPRPT